VNTAYYAGPAGHGYYFTTLFPTVRYGTYLHKDFTRARKGGRAASFTAKATHTNTTIRCDTQGHSVFNHGHRTTIHRNRFTFFQLFKDGCTAGCDKQNTVLLATDLLTKASEPCAAAGHQRAVEITTCKDTDEDDK
jgi:hypothetical protein